MKAARPLFPAGGVWPGHETIPEDVQLEDNLAKEQNELDGHDLMVEDLSLRLEKLIQDCPSKISTSGQSIASRRLTNLYERLTHDSTHWETHQSSRRS